jgi:predicted HTH domain antitoxin
MKGMINVEFPESLANKLRLRGKDFKNEMKTSSLVKLFELGKVSSGTAARVLGITRLEFLDLLEKYQVSALGQYDRDELNEDIANA